MESKDKDQSKKLNYSAPSLFMLGSVESLTRTLTVAKPNDGGTGSRQHSGP